MKPPGNEGKRQGLLPPNLQIQELCLLAHQREMQLITQGSGDEAEKLIEERFKHLGTLRAKLLAAAIRKAYQGTTRIHKNPQESIQKLMNVILTDYSIEKKKEALRVAKKRRDTCKEDMKEARSQGDLRENFGYQEAKRELQQLTTFLENLEEDLQDFVFAPTISPMDWINQEGEPPCAAVGVIVTYQEKETGEQHEVLIGGMWDDHNPEKVIPYLSPLGKALVCTEKNRETTLELAGGTKKTLIVLELTYPNETYIKKAFR